MAPHNAVTSPPLRVVHSVVSVRRTVKARSHPCKIALLTLGAYENPRETLLNEELIRNTRGRVAIKLTELSIGCSAVSLIH